MKNSLWRLSLLAALSALLSCFMVVLATPAHAVGWSGQQCYTADGYGAKVCTQVYTVTDGTAIRVEQIQVCAYRVVELYYNGFEKSKNAYMDFYGNDGTGEWKGEASLPDTGKGDCNVNTAVSIRMGKSACYFAKGTLALNGWPDRSWWTDGHVTGGGC